MMKMCSHASNKGVHQLQGAPHVAWGFSFALRIAYSMEEWLVDLAAELAHLDPVAAQRALEAARAKAKT